MAKLKRSAKAINPTIVNPIHQVHGETVGAVNSINYQMFTAPKFKYEILYFVQSICLIASSSDIKYIVKLARPWNFNIIFTWCVRRDSERHLIEFGKLDA